jgi:ornithine decarboxylase
MLSVHIPPHPPLANTAEFIPLTQTLRVPADVVNKFDVEAVAETVESLISKKLVEDTHEKEEAFYFIDLGTVLRKYQQWVQHLPRVKPFYAIKCNPNTAIIKTLANMGVNFDCASKTEIQQILGAGIAANRIIYANPTKMKSHITYAKSSGVDLMTFDNVFELEKIAECYPTSRLLLRIITDDSQSVCKFSTKFGAPLNQTRTILARAKELNLNVTGISFHVGSGCMSVQSFIAAIQSASRVFKQAEELGFNFSMLDLGGGWPGTDNDGITFTEIATAIRPVLDSHFGSEIDIIAEPGRYFVAESHTLAVNVFAKRAVEDDSEPGGKKFLYYINDGVYQSFNCIFFDHVVPTPLVFSPGNRTQNYKCTIFGPTCDSMDCIGKDILLPELEVGEWLYFKNMGAYTTAAASPFNGFKSHPNTYYIQSPL